MGALLTWVLQQAAQLVSDVCAALCQSCCPPLPWLLSPVAAPVAAATERSPSRCCPITDWLQVVGRLGLADPS